MIAIEKTYTPDELAALGTHVTLQPEQRDVIAALRSENATLRLTLIDATGQRDEYCRQLVTQTSWRIALQQELDKVLQERSQ